MAPLPTIPTSFVPHVASPARSRIGSTDFGNAFGYIAYTILAIIVAMAMGVFFYGRLLQKEKSSKDDQLAKAESSVNSDAIMGFVQLRNQLNSGQTLLASHIALSNFFSLVQSILPTTVRFTSLHISTDSTSNNNAIKVEGSGVAKSFNALAATSNAFAGDGHIKDAIFSKMTINKDSSVSFSFSANLDPKFIAFSPSATTLSTTTASTTP